jgi:hypothetical protein
MTMQETVVNKIETNAIAELISTLGLELFADYVMQAMADRNISNDKAITLVALTYAQNKAWS